MFRSVIPITTRGWVYSSSMLGQRRRRWPNIELDKTRSRTLFMDWGGGRADQSLPRGLTSTRGGVGIRPDLWPIVPPEHARHSCHLDPSIPAPVAPTDLLWKPANLPGPGLRNPSGWTWCFSSQMGRIFRAVTIDRTTGQTLTTPGARCPMDSRSTI